MQRGIGAEQWAAIRALREDAPPTFSALAAATGIKPATLRDRAAREGWLEQPLQGAARRRGRAMLLARWRADPLEIEGRVAGRIGATAVPAASGSAAIADLLAAAAGGMNGMTGEAGRTGEAAAESETVVAGGISEGPGEDGATGAGEGAALGERLERLAGLLARQVDRIVDRAEATGARLDRQGIDEVTALLKLSEKAPSLAAGGRGADETQETRSDDELARMLALLDDRVVELAHLHPEWLLAAGGRAGD